VYIILFYQRRSPRSERGIEKIAVILLQVAATAVAHPLLLIPKVCLMKLEMMKIYRLTNSLFLDVFKRMI